MTGPPRGAHWDPVTGSCRFSVWAPRAERVEVHLLAPDDRLVPLSRGDRGEHAADIADVRPGATYLFRLDGDRELPDPASRSQPAGVHGPSQVINPSFPWSPEAEAYHPPPLADLVIYELHVGTFSAAGTFEGAAERLDYLTDLGVNAIELMPVAQFPGTRNWGYDGAYPYAVQASYGGPRRLQQLVDACHRRGLAVILDFVPNHLGPEGTYVGELGPYFTDRYRTPWGDALNFDGSDSDEVRRFFLEAAAMYVEDFHIDGLRVDAVHAVVDTSAHPFLQQLCETVRDRAARAGRRAFAIAESDLDDARVLRPARVGGYGFDAQWADDFHHAVHALLTGDRNGYYADFGELQQVARAYRSPYLFTGQYSRYRRRCHGNSPRGFPGERFVVHTQNHDQVGNRAGGDRLATILTFPQQKLAACMLMLSPYVPMLFMGQEYGETAPFPYFTDHGDPELRDAVTRGRRAELVDLGWPEAAAPDPQDPHTFERARLRWERLHDPTNRLLWELHRALLALRRRLPALRELEPDRCEATAYEREQVILLRRWSDAGEVVAVLSLSPAATQFAVPLPRGTWRTELDSEGARWGGRGPSAPTSFHSEAITTIELAPYSCVVFSREL